MYLLRLLVMMRDSTMLGPCVQEPFSLVSISFHRETDIFDRESSDSNRVGLGGPRRNSLGGTHVSVLLTLVCTLMLGGLTALNTILPVVLTMEELCTLVLLIIRASPLCDFFFLRLGFVLFLTGCVPSISNLPLASLPMWRALIVCDDGFCA